MEFMNLIILIYVLYDTTTLITFIYDYFGVYPKTNLNDIIYDVSSSMGLINLTMFVNQ